MVNAVLKRAKEFLLSEDGTTVTEYAVMLALIITVVMSAITVLGTKVSTVFKEIEHVMSVHYGV